MQPARARWSTETVASFGVAILGVATIAVGIIRELVALSVVMLIGGAAWIIFISLVTALVQKLAPDWVRARVLAVFMLVFQGATAAGSVLWGVIGQHHGVASALTWAGLGGIATIGLGLVWKLPDTTMDVTPWNHWRAPVIPDGLELDVALGPVLVTIEYNVDSAHAHDFLKAIHRYQRIRRRDGATRWGIYRDTERPDLYLETFIVSSWAEHLRQHERFTRSDYAIEERINKYVSKEPQVRHMIYAMPKP
jgi:MFS family permease